MNKTRAALGGAVVLALAAPLVAHFEGLSLVPYQDPVGIETVCYGDTHAQMRAYTSTECKLMLMDSLADHGAAIAACLPPDLPDHVQAAVLSFGYNIGAAKFCSSTMAKKLRAGDLRGACAQLSLWAFVGGKDCRDPANRCSGIVKRRAAEREMCERATA